VKVTVLSHNLSSNAVMRAHRLSVALAAEHEVRLLGPVEKAGPWTALPSEPWIRSVRKVRFPEFATSFEELVEQAQGDVLVAVKPQLASFGAALVAGELRDVPVVLDLDDLDVSLAPREQWSRDPSKADLSRPGSAVYVYLLTRATGAAAAITVASRALQRRFGGTLVPHGSDGRLFDPARIDRDEARRHFGFSGPTVVFPGTPREHKGIGMLARAVARLPDARLAVPCRPEDLAGPEWAKLPIERLPQLPWGSLPELIAAGDVVALPQLDTEAASHQVPMKAFDAMAMGAPIVASAVSDLPEMLDGCARLVPAGDERELERALADLLSNRDEARTLGDRARRRFLERYSLEQLGETLDAVMRSVAR
jgi:glycosyltransferase involved in cell wall biosynthesis